MKYYELSPQTPLRPLLENLGVTPEGIRILEKKATVRFIYLQDLKTPAANILKQDALSAGGDLAVPKGTICCQNPTVNALLMATDAQIKQLAKKALRQPFGLKQLGVFLQGMAPSVAPMPAVMGVINLNEDSFFEQSRFEGKAALGRVREMIEQGAQYIDIGAVSSRPGSQSVCAEEEMARLRPVVEAIAREKLYEKAIFSLDSYTPSCLEYALDHGFGFINDITGLADEAVLDLAARYAVPVCVMHMQGTPWSMQENPEYEDVVWEVDAFFQERIGRALEKGVQKLVLDVGIGFGKTLTHNLLLLKHHHHFTRFGYPLLIGVSRKSMIHALSPSLVHERLGGTLALHLEAVRNGASIVRCHDVQEHVQALRIQRALAQTGVQGGADE